MKILIMLPILMSATMVFGGHYVQKHTRANGTVVQRYYRETGPGYYNTSRSSSRRSVATAPSRDAYVASLNAADAAAYVAFETAARISNKAEIKYDVATSAAASARGAQLAPAALVAHVARADADAAAAYKCYVVAHAAAYTAAQACPTSIGRNRAPQTLETNP